MTKDKAIEKLKTLQKSENPEAAHGDADEVLCDLLTALGYIEVVQEWKKVDKWYG